MFVYPVLPMVAQDKQTQKLKLIEKLKIKAIYWVKLVMSTIKEWFHSEESF